MSKTFNLLVGSAVLLASTGCVLNASQQTTKYDNLNQVVNPNGEKAYVLTYFENADGVLDKKLTINIPKLPYKTSFNLCPDAKVEDKCKGFIDLAEEDGEYFINYNVRFLEEMEGEKPIMKEMENQDAILDLNKKSDEDKYFIYSKMKTTTSYWILKK